MQQTIDSDNEQLEADISNYWQIFGWRQDPFATLDIAGDYYKLPHWEEYLDLLQYLCLYNNVIAIVSGTDGSGKTTLMNQFIRQAKDTLQICQITAHNNLTTEQLVEVFSEAFHIPWQNANSLEDQLDAQLALLQAGEKNCVLVVDDAQNLPLETLQAFLYLISQQTETKVRLHIVLFGEPQLISYFERLFETEAEQNLIQHLELQPLDCSETENYIMHRLQAVGANELTLPLTPAMMGRIYQLSGGIPGRINRITRRSLLNELAKQDMGNTLNFWSEHRAKLIGAAVSVIVLLFVAFFLSQLNEAKNETQEKKTVEPLIAFNDSAPVKTQDLSIQAPQPTSISQAQNSLNQPILDTVKDTSSQKNADKDEQVAALPEAPATVMPPQNSSTSIDASVLGQMPVSLKAQQTTASPAVSVTPPSNQTIEQTPSEIIADPSAKSAVSTTTTDAQRTTSMPSPKAEPKAKVMAYKDKPALEKKLEVKSPAKSLAKPLPVTTTGYAIEKRLLAENPNAYVIQLGGFSQEATAKKLIQTHKLAGKAVYFRSYHQGKEIYLLIYGPVANKQAALTVIKNFPKELQTLKPWPRSVANMQAAIRQQQSVNKGK